VSHLRKYTSVRVALPFVSGIAIALYIDAFPSPFLVLSILFSCVTGLILFYIFLRQNFQLRWISGFLAGASLFLGGYYLVLEKSQRNLLDNLQSSANICDNVYLCRIEDSPGGKSAILSGSATLLAGMQNTGQWQKMECKVMLSFRSDSISKSLCYGDVILISGIAQAVKEPANPFMFDYKKYLRSQGIIYRIFLENGSWQKSGRRDFNPVRLAAETCKRKFLDVLRKFKVEGREFALVTALLIGEKDYLENETIREFSYAGAIHVLSVSGLHVGIMYVMVDRLLFFMKRGRKSRKLQYLIIIASIWAYALVAGLPSSVVRASLMFSLVAAGNLLKRNAESFSVVASAAFLQLWITPFDLAQIGFQLSYLAVLGIFAFYKPINELISSDNRIVNWTWSVIAVSLAAQLATSPLACYYFHMFPVYFLVTNLVVVPLAGFITYFAVVLLVAGAAGIYFEFLAWPLKVSAGLMEDAVTVIQSWPGAVAERILLNEGQVLLLYLAILALFFFWVLGNRYWLLALFVIMIGFSLISNLNLFQRISSNKLIVYQVPGHTAIDLISGRKALFYCDSLLSRDNAKITFQIEPNRIHSGISTVHPFSGTGKYEEGQGKLWWSYPFIGFNDKTVVIIDKSWKNSRVEKPVSVDLAIFSGIPSCNLPELISQVSFGRAIIDSSLPYYKTAELAKSLENAGIPFCSVGTEGAYVMEW
jgi:competence protein ComEC